MPKTPHLISGYLEHLSGDLLAEYPEEIEAFVAGLHGIYALYRNDDLYYVGLATNLKSRLKQHMKDRHSGKWNRFNIYQTTDGGHMKDLESILLRVCAPKGNKVKGKFSGAANLAKSLKRNLDEAHRAKSVMLLGLPAKPVKRARATTPAAAVPKTAALRADYKGKVFKARLRLNGTVRLGSRVFASLSAAGIHVVGHNISGPWFWKVKNAAGEWVRIRSLA